MKKEMEQLKEEMPLVVPYVVYDAEMKRKQKLIYISWFIIFAMIIGWLVYSYLPSKDISQEVDNVDNIENSEIKAGTE